MDSIVDLLWKIRARPGLYLGYPSVNNLYMFLQGYTFARHEDAKEDNKFLSGFGDMVSKRFRITTSQGWAKTIEFFSSSPDDEMELFWKLLDTYIAQRKPARKKVS